MKAIISPNCRIRYPESFFVQDNSVVDDFCYFSTRVFIGEYSHIASQCTIAGGNNSYFECGRFGGLASGVRIFCSSDDFVNDIANVLPSECQGIKNCVIEGDVILKDFVTIGTNTVIMPGNVIPEGAVIGAMSFVPKNCDILEPWGVYAGIHKLRLIGKRNKTNILREAEEVYRRMNK